MNAKKMLKPTLLLATITFCGVVNQSFADEPKANTVVTETMAQKKPVPVFRWMKKTYHPPVPKRDQAVQQALLSQIQQGLEYDNQIAKQFQENAKLVPFDDLFDEYGKVFRNNDTFLAQLLAGYIDEQVIKAYLSYYSNVTANFAQNLNLAKARGLNPNTARNITQMLENLNIQQATQENFFGYILKERLY